jgi:dihydrodipicolinate synthase/N-acetylneuraminate lyase
MNKLRGSVFSVPMFFKKDKSIDFVSLENYIKKCLENPGVELIYAMSYNTRLRQLSLDEIIKVSKLCCELAKSYNKKAIIGHPYTITSDELHDYCQLIKKYNPYAISVLYPERYYGKNQPLIDFYSIPKKSNLNVLVHEQKLVSGFNGSLIDWPDDLISEVFRDKNIIAVKEDSKNDIITSKILKISKKQV